MNFGTPKLRHVLEKEWARDEYGIEAAARSGRLKGFCGALDIGANIGFITRKLWERLPEGARLVAVEPSPAAFRLLMRNCGRRIDVLIEAALGRGWLRPEGNQSMGSERFTPCAGDHPEAIACMTLPELARYARMDPRHLLIKIDAEGAERDLMGDAEAERILREARALCMELHASDMVPMGELVKWFWSLAGRHRHVRICQGARPQSALVGSIWRA